MPPSVNPTKHVPCMRVENKREPTQDLTGMTPERSLGLTIRALRESEGRSQDDVAKIMYAYGHKWQQTTMAKTEAGQRPIRVNEMVDLARILNVSPGDLINISVRMSDAGLRFYAALARRNTAKRHVEEARSELSEREANLAQMEQELVEAQQAFEEESATGDEH
jgi:transcriptional regulator with XRE-family HTH domain